MCFRPTVGLVADIPSNVPDAACTLSKFIEDSCVSQRICVDSVCIRSGKTVQCVDGTLSAGSSTCVFASIYASTPIKAQADTRSTNRNTPGNEPWRLRRHGHCRHTASESTTRSC